MPDCLKARTEDVCPLCSLRCCAQAYINWVRAFAHPCYKAGLQQAGREEQDAECVLQQYFDNLREAALKDPAPAEVPFTSVLLRRRR